MSGQSGPEYPGSSDGLVFCWDPKNPRSIPKPFTDDMTTYSTVQSSNIVAYGENISTDELEGIYTPQGYVTLDGTDDRFLLGPTGAGENKPANGTFSFTDEFTISVWARTADYTYNTGKQRLITYGDAGDDSGYFFGWYGYYVNLYIWSTAGAKLAKWANPGSTNITNNVWYNFVAVKKSNSISDNMVTWINGIEGNAGSSLKGTATDIDYGSYSSGTPLKGSMGTSWSVGTNEWYGDFGPMMIWNRALSDDEIKNQFFQLQDRFGAEYPPTFT